MVLCLLNASATLKLKLIENMAPRSSFYYFVLLICEVVGCVLLCDCSHASSKTQPYGGGVKKLHF